MALPHPRLDAFWAATTPDATAAIADMDEALQEWAGEAMLADPDGYWIGHWNWFIYDHPTRGWLWIPHDLDVVINWLDPRIDPIYYWGGDTGVVAALAALSRGHQGSDLARTLRRRASPRARGLRGGPAPRDARSLRGAGP